MERIGVLLMANVVMNFHACSELVELCCWVNHGKMWFQEMSLECGLRCTFGNNSCGRGVAEGGRKLPHYQNLIYQNV